MLMKRIAILLLIVVSTLATARNKNSDVDNSLHPRIYCSDANREAFLKSVSETEWKKIFVEKKKQSVEKYIQYCLEDPEWLLSRLQMNWKTKHSNVYLHGGDFSHSDGTAPVPTVRFSGTRDWATNYKTPSLEDLEPYFDDERGFFLENKKTGKKEWVRPAETGHMIEGINNRIMSIVKDAAFLYWLTGDDKYAKFAAPVFFTYINGMYYRNAPIDLDKSSQANISGLATFEVIHESIVPELVLCYDYLFNYFTASRQNLDTTVSVFQKWGDQIIENGIPDNNWNLFQARFLTYIALALDDDERYANGKGQQYYLRHTFEVSTPRQISIKESLLVYDQQTGIWPEAASYSVHVNTTFLEILTLLDNVTNANELSNFPIIEKAALACFQYLSPTGYLVGFGDSNHNPIPFENLELLIANYHKYGLFDKQQSITNILQTYIEQGQYHRKANDLFDFNFYVDRIKEGVKGSATAVAELQTPTFYAPNVSLFIQRMGSGEDALMVSTAGSYGNHAHANGIAMELFANKYAIGPDMGRGQSYWSDDFKEFYSKMPAHNTVVVDGISTYANMRSYYPFTLDQCYPKPGVSDPLFKKVSFSKVSFVEPKTNALQQRFTAIVSTNSGTVYILDVFRSKKEVSGTQQHDYFYHNIGHSLTILDEKDQPLDLNETDDLSSKKGCLKAYDYLSDKKSIVWDKDIKAVFDVNGNSEPENTMKVWIKGCDNQTIYAAKSPKSNALSEGTAPISLLGAKTPTLILRRDEEAWSNPFVLVFNPFTGQESNPVEKVTFSADSISPRHQIITVSQADHKTIDRIVVATSSNDVMASDDFYLKGLWSVIRMCQTHSRPDFMFVSGTYQFKYHDWEILALGKSVTVSIEQSLNGWMIQNDQPVLLKIPLSGDFYPSKIRLFAEDDTFVEREGHISRFNPNQMEFRLTKSYNKAVIMW
jgi:hypothetical protein